MNDIYWTRTALNTLYWFLTYVFFICGKRVDIIWVSAIGFHFFVLSGIRVWDESILSYMTKFLCSQYNVAAFFCMYVASGEEYILCKATNPALMIIKQWHGWTTSDDWEILFMNWHKTASCSENARIPVLNSVCACMQVKKSHGCSSAN